VESNIIGTLNILEAARKLAPRKFIYVSTDEVFGPAQEGQYKEDDPLRPTNPYAATKAGGELLVYSYFRSFGLPVVITRTMNMFGERQHPEKFVPMTIGKILRGEKIDIHVSAAGKCSSRQWLHARVQGQMLRVLLDKGVPGQNYQLAGTPANILDIAQMIAICLRQPLQWREVLSDRPVHDLSYAVDDSSLREIWTPILDLETSLLQTVSWSEENPQWLEP
jgi:dTDP-glucose 4,6-dehydratase